MKNRFFLNISVFLIFISILFGFNGSAFARKHKEFPIFVVVDFGPAGKPRHEEKLHVEKGTTAKEAVSQIFPIMSGKTCCSFREIMEIGGVRVDPAKNRWWICTLNGSKKFSPTRKKLKLGDRIEWKFIEEQQ